LHYLKIMKIKLLVFILFFGSLGFAFRGMQNAKNKITENDYFDFINAITSSWTKSLNPNQLSVMSNKPAIDEIYADTILIYKDPSFSKRDIGSLRKQLSANKGYTWPKAKLINYRILAQTDIDGIINGSNDGWKDFSKKYGNAYYVYSVPLFSFDKKRCIIAAGQVCGAKCAKGSVVLYTKEGNDWKKTKEYGSWKE